MIRKLGTAALLGGLALFGLMAGSAKADDCGCGYWDGGYSGTYFTGYTPYYGYGDVYGYNDGNYVYDMGTYGFNDCQYDSGRW